MICPIARGGGRHHYAAPRERAPYDWLDERERYDDRYRDDRYRKRKKKDFLDVLFDL